MKILIIHETSDRTEIALYLSLAKAGHEVYLLHDPRDLEAEKLSPSLKKTYPIKLSSRFSLAAIKKIRKIIRKEKINLIFAPPSKGIANACFASFGLKIKLVTYRGTMGGLSYLSPDSWLAHLNPQVDKIVCNCQAVYDSLVKIRIPKLKLSMIYKGHSSDWYLPKGKLTRSDFNLIDSDFVIGCFSNIRKKKGIDYLLKAIDQLPKDSNIKLLLVGELVEKNLKEEIETLLKKENIKKRVKILGFRNDALDIMDLCNLTIVPSKAREGLPRSMVESMFKGIPVLATSVGGVPEIIKDEENGFLVHATHDYSRNIALKLEKLEKDPEKIKKTSIKAQKTVKHMLNHKKALKSYLELFESLF